MEVKPLDGITVIELTTYVAAPICGRMLEDFGAHAIKIEAVEGDSWRTMGVSMCFGNTRDENPLFDIYNSGKKCITLNLKTEKGMEIMDKLLKTADVFLTNTRLKSLVKLGLAPDAVREKYPALVYALMTGYGDKGPEAERPGFDNVAFWTKTGFLRDMAVETEGGYPVDSPASFGDSVSGMALLSGILAALMKRNKTGKGDYVTTSLYANGIWVMGSMIIRTQPKYGEKFPKTRPMCIPLNQSYLCSDGEWVKIAILDFNRYAHLLFDLLGYPEMKNDPKFMTKAAVGKNRAEVIDRLERAFIKRPSAEWISLLREHDFVCDPLTHFRDVSTCEQAWANGYVESFECPNGEKPVMPCNPIYMESQGILRSKRAPFLGEHTDEILQEYGYSPEEIEQLKKDGITAKVDKK